MKNITQQPWIGSYDSCWTLVKSVYQKNVLISKPKYMLWYSKEPSQWNGSFEHPHHMLKLLGKKMFTILLCNIVFS